MNATFVVINEMVSAGIIGRYAVAGAVGALFYLEPLLTSDLDVLVSVEGMKQPGSGLVTLSSVYEYLARKGYSEFREEGVLIEGWPVQFLPVANALDTEALEQAVETEIEDDRGTKVRVLRPEHLVAIALRVGRYKDYVRVRSFVDEKKVDLQALKGVLDRHGLTSKWKDFCDKTGIEDPRLLNLPS
jgi:hypothetical protein